MTAGLLLQVEGLTLRVGDATLLKNFDWKVHAGEFWCVLGKNGIGKSTLLHAIAGLLPPASGRIGSPVGEVRRTTPQQLALWRGLQAQQQFDAFSCSVLDSVMAGLHPYRPGWGWPDAADRRAALHVLERLDMASYADADVMRLSGGERQRVAMATLMLQAPQLYLLDEPASHQDVAAQLLVMRTLKELADDDHAVVATMHDINLAARFASHVLLIAEGKVWQGRAADILRPDLLEAAYGCRFEAVDSAGGRWLMPA
ncbi:cobalamin ABC transporter ATPase [Herbaspirillum hiltneri N3]|uniref:Cobalamin ABC transporter ATPase n=1 Tax=Herbaspirillum hiltneri N3 TaxID=1262470 RepID=A0ABN4HYX8_9BURK|nr:ABC transporter ATP-binding protein [Herbaspirillum hiltneri]AKZ63802.1 cobalamin ABC transporter ATPase [Herbaspirillum hiltneri N3]